MFLVQTLGIHWNLNLVGVWDPSPPERLTLLSPPHVSTHLRRQLIILETLLGRKPIKDPPSIEDNC